ncbi:hypothetical protein BGW80DRAFT_1561575 [Lactifluus volemus]|nr:hypothetical protein BGW80DRAFT_1561575 [Lactifluus volemus]
MLAELSVAPTLPMKSAVAEYSEELTRAQTRPNLCLLGEQGVARMRKRRHRRLRRRRQLGNCHAGTLRRRPSASHRLTLSSLNHHATAALADVGTPKLQCIARALYAIAPFVQVDPRIELWRGGAEGAELLQGEDWVVDPSSADADADDDPSSAPSPASSAREYSIPVVYSPDVPRDDGRYSRWPTLSPSWAP